jgi:hypothetical protein
MGEDSSIASDVITASTALAGLLLVFLGGLVSAYQSYDAEQQPSVRAGYRGKAWFAFAGFLFALLSGALAFIGKIWGEAAVVAVAIAMLGAAFVWTAASAYLSAREI